MAVMIEMSPDLYDRLWSHCAADSREYAVLKNGVVVNRPIGERVIEIPCEPSDAENLLAVANKICPDAVPAIKKVIAAPQ